MLYYHVVLFLKDSSEDASLSSAPHSGVYWMQGCPCSRTLKSSGTQWHPLYRNSSTGAFRKQTWRQFIGSPNSVSDWILRFPSLKLSGLPISQSSVIQCIAGGPFGKAWGIISESYCHGAAGSYPLGTQAHLPSPCFQV